ncbi:DUF2231 domain-containing protein [Hydrogenimonas sp. SS33]|uniref:DUF2231 domain-containing protein n=1 Tax=Hydrogenimonas leucolamina TaxID=2954236 RepID=UPI00336C210D
MNLPVIDIPVKLPFEVPLLIHPIFVHFAIAIPVIVFLLEIANIKARNRAVSVTSLFLMTLALLVYAGAFFAGKADGSHAWALLSPDAQKELKFHKLLGTYLVYGMGVLYLLKLLAMLVKRPWARDFFLAMLLIFIGVLFKQGKDGGELVYEYGVNVEAVSKLQDKIDDMEYQIDDLKTQVQKAKAAAAAPAATQEAPANQEAPAAQEPKSEESAPATEETAPAEPHEPATEEPAHSAAEAVKSQVEEKAQKAAEEATEEAAHTMETAGDALKKSAEEAAGAAVEGNDTTPVEIPTH